MSYTTTVGVTTVTEWPPELDNATSWEPRNTSLTADHVVQSTLPVIPQWISGCYCVLLCMSVFFGIPGNAITAAAYANIKPKTSCDWYIMSVAIIDLATCSFRNTSYFMEYLGVWARLTCAEYCKFTAWVGQSTVCMSIFLFALMAIDRYMKLCQSARQSITPATSRNLTLALTLVNVIIATPTLVLFDNNERGICQVKSEDAKNKLVTAYYSAIFFLFLVMMLIVIFCYVRIAIKVRSSRQVAVMELPKGDAAVIRHDDVVEEYTSSFTNGQLKNPTTSDFVCVGHALQDDGPLKHSEPEASFMKSANAPPLESQPQHDGAARSSHKAFSLNTGAQLVLSLDVAEKDDGGDALRRIQTKRKCIRQQRNIRVTGLLFVITSVFIVSWVAPYAAMVKGFYVGYTLPLSAGDVILSQYGPNIYVVNTFSNPLIYATMSPAYRKLVWDFMRRTKASLLKPLRPCV